MKGGSPHVTVAVDSEGDATIVRISGDFDRTTLDDVRPVVEGLAADGSDLIVDVSATTLIDSSGIGLLVEMRADAGEAGRGFRVICESGWQRGVFVVTGLTSHLGVVLSDG